MPFLEPVPPLAKRRVMTRGKIPLADKISIAFKAIVEHEKLANVAKEFRTTTTAVSSIVRKVMSSPKAIEEMQFKRDEVEEKRAAIRRVVKSMLVKEDFIDSAATVKKKVLEETE